MKVEQLYTGCLSEAAYYIESNGEAAIIDPLREVEPYLQKAKENNVPIKYIFETHFHADFVSGHVDLAQRSGATIVYGPKAETAYQTHVAADGEIFKLGDITIEVLHTPGHTPESTTYLLRDEGGKPYCIFTGDTLFIGDVGRPDLAVKGDLSKEDLAGLLYDSLRQKIMPLPDDVLVYPAHGAGSACGKNMSKETFSTLGEQKQSNYALQNLSKEEFIAEVTEGIMPPPQYFPKNALLNKQGYSSIEEVYQKGMIGLEVDALNNLEKNTIVLDVRHHDEFREGHIPGSLNIPLDGSFAVWVGTLIEDLNTPLFIISPIGREHETITRLARVGYDNTIGYLKGGIEAWESSGNSIEKVSSINVQELAEKVDVVDILDVRKPSEFEAEHVEGATNFPLDFIYQNLSNLDKEKTYHLHCKSGYRSMIASAILRREGFSNIIDIKGGFDAILESEIKTTEYICPTTKK